MASQVPDLPSVIITVNRVAEINILLFSEKGTWKIEFSFLLKISRFHVYFHDGKTAKNFALFKMKITKFQS